MRAALVPTNRDDSAVNAMRRSTPWTNIACASMKLPMNRKMIGSANGASAAWAGATQKHHRQHRPQHRRDGHRQRFA